MIKLEITEREQYLIELALKQLADRVEVEKNRKPSYQNIARSQEIKALYNKVLHSSGEQV